VDPVDSVRILKEAIERNVSRDGEKG